MSLLILIAVVVVVLILGMLLINLIPDSKDTPQLKLILKIVLILIAILIILGQSGLFAGRLVR